MKRRDLSLSIALCVSLVLHASLMLWVLRAGAGTLRWARWQTPPVPAASTTPQDDHPIYDPHPPDPPALLPQVPIEDVVDSPFGDSEGKGKALNAIPGD